jgi:pyruvoyl-dependent arginine decarboxylase
MAQAQSDQLQRTRSEAEVGLDITIRTGSGIGHTKLSAFDRALQKAGVADFNLVTLSSVIPPQSRIRNIEGLLAGGHGDLLFCVRAEAFAEQPGEIAWAGLGWVTDETGGGLFVEHHGGSEESVVEQIELSLADMNATRGGGYGPVQMALASAHSTGLPVCALVLAAYRVSSWHDPGPKGNPEPAPEVVDLDAHRAPPSGLAEAPSLNGAIPHGWHPKVEATTSVSVAVEKEIDFVAARSFYQLYLDTFDALETQAAARHLLSESEFVEEMLDRRIDKYVARDAEDRAIGMTTLTNELSAVPWISPGYYAERYPDQHARSAIYYLGLTLVHPEHRNAQIFHTMSEPIVQRVLAERGIIAWDMCAANDARGLSATSARIIRSIADATIEPVDRQTYYAAVLHGPRQDRPDH